MFKHAFMSLAALAGIGFSGADASAQCCCTGGSVATVTQPAVAPVETYQRFSYSPSVGLDSSTPIAAASVIRSGSASVAGPVRQVFRRFSYQPSRQAKVSSSPTKRPWQYPKGDRRRYMH